MKIVRIRSAAERARPTRDESAGASKAAVVGGRHDDDGDGGGRGGKGA